MVVTKDTVADMTLSARIKEFRDRVNFFKKLSERLAKALDDDKSDIAEVYQFGDTANPTYETFSAASDKEVKLSAWLTGINSKLSHNMRIPILKEFVKKAHDEAELFKEGVYDMFGVLAEITNNPEFRNSELCGKIAMCDKFTGFETRFTDAKDHNLRVNHAKSLQSLFADGEWKAPKFKKLLEKVVNPPSGKRWKSKKAWEKLQTDFFSEGSALRNFEKGCQKIEDYTGDEADFTAAAHFSNRYEKFTGFDMSQDGIVVFRAQQDFCDKLTSAMDLGDSIMDTWI